LLCRYARQHSPFGFERCLEDPKQKRVAHWVERNWLLSSLQAALRFSDPIQRSDGDGRDGNGVKEPFCSPQHKAGLRCNTEVVRSIPQCKSDSSAEDGPGCGRKTLQRGGTALLQTYGEGTPNHTDMGREGCCPPKGLTDPGAMHGDRSMEKEVPERGT